MYNFDYFDAFLTNTLAFPSEVKYHNALIDNILDNEQAFLDLNNNRFKIETFDANKETIDVYNHYQLLKQFVLENAALLKYEQYFKARKRQNNMSFIKYREKYSNEAALQALFLPFMMLKELLQAQTLMPKFPYKSNVTLKCGKQTETILEITFDKQEEALMFNLDIICSSKEIYYHALGLGIAHGTYFDNMTFHSNLKQSLKILDKYVDKK